MAEDPKKLDRFKTQMPEIPGITTHVDPLAGADASGEVRPSHALALRMAGPAVAIVVLAALGFWLFLRTSRPAPAAPPGAGTANPAAAPPAVVASPQSGPVVVARLEELATPWSSKSFVFQKNSSNQSVYALAVRLPGPVNNVGSYWAFSLEQPFGKCRLEWVTDLAKLSSQYEYPARHPMLASPCDGTLYDPLKLGTIVNGAWVRGEVVHGSGIRPPFSIELRLDGGQIIATRIE